MSESFNVVIANHMLYHVPDLTKTLSEVRRVLKTGSYFYASTNGNGGMHAFLRDAIRQLHPESKAFAQGFSFHLQNGGELLAPYFSSVKRMDYIDSLVVTGTRDLMGWLQSALSFLGLLEEDLDGLYDYLEAIRVKDGAIRIPKENGLFICQK